MKIYLKHKIRLLKGHSSIENQQSWCPFAHKVAKPIVLSIFVTIIMQLNYACNHALSSSRDRLVLSSQSAAHKLISIIDDTHQHYNKLIICVDSFMYCHTASFAYVENSKCSDSMARNDRQIFLSLPKRLRRKLPYYTGIFETDTIAKPTLIAYSPLIATDRKDTFLMQRFVYYFPIDTSIIWNPKHEDSSKIAINKEMAFQIRTFEFELRDKKPIFIRERHDLLKRASKKL